MGFCHDKVKPALKSLMKEIKQAVLADAAGFISDAAPLLADGRVSKTDIEALGVSMLKRTHGISTTAAMIGINFAHEMLTKAGATVSEMQAASESPETVPIDLAADLS